MSLPILLLLVAALLTVISLVQRLAGRLTLPASILFALPCQGRAEALRY